MLASGAAVRQNHLIIRITGNFVTQSFAIRTRSIGMLFVDIGLTREVFCLIFNIDVVSFCFVLMALNSVLIFVDGLNFLRGVAIILSKFAFWLVNYERKL